MSIISNRQTTNETCLPALLWNQTSIDNRRPSLYVCIIAVLTHSIFWFQLVICPTVRQKSMQWLYAYLITDILLLIRFFVTFIVHTTTYECIVNQTWSAFVCYTEAALDNYLNITEVYILLALNLCRYAQIVFNRNVYVANFKLIILAHLSIYLMPLISLIIQIYSGAAQVTKYPGESCDVTYTNIYVKIFNVALAFVLPILLNVGVIAASIRHIHLTSQLRQAQHHISAREKYHRSLVIQFFIFYTIWLLLWSPNVIVYQFTTGASKVTLIPALLNYIEIALDPLIIGALDVRFYQAWKHIWLEFRNRRLRRLQIEQRRIGPTTIETTMQLRRQK